MLRKGILLFTMFFAFQFYALAQDNRFVPTIKGQLIEHSNYLLDYNEFMEQANWVTYELLSEETVGPYSRTDNFRADPSVKTGSAQLSDYKKSGFDRGHLMPAGDCTFDHLAMSESFFMSNMNPQSSKLNRGIWKKLEEKTRGWSQMYGVVYVVTGGVSTSSNPNVLGANKVVVPNYFYKVILFENGQETQAIAFLFPHLSSGSYGDLKQYMVTIDKVESLTGIDFFSELEDEVELKVESSVGDLVFWPLSVKTNKSPKTKSSSAAQQCLGISSSTGVRCKNKTKNKNQHCHHHQAQAEK